ncbi:MAG: hypothetical protein CVU51_01445 [Deltaproteobacteria bacterium HGW-Deltaproteobacteria-1]|jgi:hypothetical protein|nr:MAG: hypothetical protein CVU51_01445 [Deltaproteobacteria bacterium HGW-Deltaproteobacteria-1]
MNKGIKMRKLFLIIVLILAVILTVKFDLLTAAKLGLENLFYKQDIQRIGSFHILVEVTNPEIEREGLTRESIRKIVVDALEKSGVRIIPDELWQKTPGRPSLNIWVNALPAVGQKGIYQYMINLAVTRREDDAGVPSIPQKDKVIWSTSELGKDDVKAIRNEITRLTEEFLKAHSGG